MRTTNYEEGDLVHFLWGGVGGMNPDFLENHRAINEPSRIDSVIPESTGIGGAVYKVTLPSGHQIDVLHGNISHKAGKAPTPVCQMAQPPQI